MARYIDVDKMLEKIREIYRVKPSGDTFTDHFCAFNDNNCKQIIREIVEELPNADVVEVVRCKNCKHSNDDGTICRYSVGRAVEPEYFCGYGKVRADNDL